jgi:hypothetical protein
MVIAQSLPESGSREPCCGTDGTKVLGRNTEICGQGVFP